MVRGTSDKAEFFGQNGFGLIEVMIAVVITAIVSLQLASIFQFMGANANSLKGLTGAQSVRSSLLQLITLQTNCGAHLLPQYTAAGYFNLGQAGSATGLPIGFTGYDGSQIFGLDPVTPVGTPVPLTNYDVSVNYLVFEGANLVGPDGLGNTVYQGQLVASLSKMANSQMASGGNGLLPVTVGSLVLAVDGTNTIQYCYAQPMTAASACSALGGTYVATVNPPAPPCELPYPCASGLIFEGYDTSVPPQPICNPSAALGVLTCPPGHGVISNGTGYICN